MKLYVYPYTSGSESAKLLAERLGALRIKLQNSTYVHDPKRDLVVNWGNSRAPAFDNMLNKPAMIERTVDKLKFFRLMMQAGQAGYLPPYWTNYADIPDEAFPILCRTTTTGCDGAGIVIANNRGEVQSSPLYTSLIKDAMEYRVTLFKDDVTDIQTKLPRIGQMAHPYIRTYANGWGFQRKPVMSEVENKIVAAAKAALRVSGLDFAGVDVLFSNGRVYILEVNTAMGLEGDALNRFAAAVEAYAASLSAEYPEAPIVAPGASPAKIDPILTAVADKRWADVAQMAVLRLANGV